MQSIGKKGENHAATFLKEQGYHVLNRNYRYKRAEIDLICKRQDLLVFVEVKTRTSAAYGQPESFVSESQQQSIIRGAEQYLEEIGWTGDIRFDVIAILDRKGKQEISHFKDAFY